MREAKAAARGPGRAAALMPILALAAFLRLFHLGQQSFWLDESHKTFNALKPVGDILAQAIHNVDAPYHLVLHFWILAFGQSELAIRALSAISGILFVPAIYLAAGHLLGGRARVPAALLATLAPLHIYYSQEAATYPHVMLLALGSLWSFDRLLERPDRRRAAAYVILVLLLNYLLAHGAFVFATQIGYTGWLLIRRRPRGWFTARAQILAAILSLPKAAVLLLQVKIDANPWIPALEWTFPAQTFAAFTVRGWRLPQTAALDAAMWFGLPAAALLLAFGLAAGGDRRGLIRLHLLGPLGLLIVTSLRKANYVPGRYDTIIFPAFILALAGGIAWLPRRTARTVATGVLAAAMALPLPEYYSVFVKSNDREVVNWLKSVADPADVLVFTDLTIASFYYHAGRETYPQAFSLLPYFHQGWIAREALYPEPSYANRRVHELQERIYPRLHRSNRLFVVRFPTEMDNHLLPVLDRDLERLAVFPFVEGDGTNQIADVIVYRTRAAPETEP